MKFPKYQRGFIGAATLIPLVIKGIAILAVMGIVYAGYRTVKGHFEHIDAIEAENIELRDDFESERLEHQKTKSSLALEKHLRELDAKYFEDVQKNNEVTQAQLGSIQETLTMALGHFSADKLANIQQNAGDDEHAALTKRAEKATRRKLDRLQELGDINLVYSEFLGDANER